VSEIVDVLRGVFVAGNFAGPPAITNYGSWVGNNAVAEVQADIVGAPFAFTFQTLAGRYRFAPEDNVVILSAWLCLPYHYVLSRPGATLQFMRGDALTVAPIAQVSPPAGTINVPVANSEIALGPFVPWVGVAGSFMSIGAALLDAWVSQIGAPALLNGVRSYSVPCVKVLHNMPLT